MQVSLENSRKPVSRLHQKHHHKSVTYNPTPISHTNKSTERRHSSGHNGGARHIPVATGPQYNPTPIEVLRKQSEIMYLRN